MKFFFIPVATLSLLLGISLWNGWAVEKTVEPWREALEEAVTASEREDWAAAKRILDETRSGWTAKHAWFHIVTAHDELDRADALFAQAQSFAAEQDRGEFRACAEELSGQLLVVAERQKLSLKNTL